MKLIESKFYRPIHIFEPRSINGTYTLTSKEFIETVTNEDEPFEDILNRLMPSIYLGNTEMVIRTENLQEFVECTDFHTAAFHNKKEIFYNQEACYFYPEYEFFILTSDDLASEYNEFIVEAGMSRVTRVYYDSSNPKSPENLKLFYDKFLQKYISKEAKISILIKTDDEFSFKHHKIHPYNINLHTMYNEDFLPVHKKIKDDLTNTHKGVILLHGIAGSGKTNYIKWLTSQIPEKNFIFVPNSLIQLLTDPAFISILIGQQNSVIVLEDCENYISERSIDNSQSDVVASILNIADGMLSDVLECQFICTFNAHLTEIDHALLRRGRLIAEYYFDELSVDRCNAYLNSIKQDADADKTIIDKPMTLAQLTHIDEEEYTASKPEDVKFGFV